MTKKDYVALAIALKAARINHEVKPGSSSELSRLRGTEQAALEIADTLASENPRFNRARFLAACGVPS